jgi:hypothetical protein
VGVGVEDDGGVDGFGVLVRVGVCVGVLVGDGVIELVGVTVNVGVEDGVLVGVKDIVGVGVGVGQGFELIHEEHVSNVAL